MISALVCIPRNSLLALVRGYRYFLSPWLGSSCRFEPSCSSYALVALQTHGAVFGTALTVGRLLRCGPWCAGGHDPVPMPRRWALSPWSVSSLADHGPTADTAHRSICDDHGLSSRSGSSPIDTCGTNSAAAVPIPGPNFPGPHP